MILSDISNSMKNDTREHAPWVKMAAAYHAIRLGYQNRVHIVLNDQPESITICNPRPFTDCALHDNSTQTVEVVR